MIDESRLYAIPSLQRKPLCDVCEWAETRHFLRSTSQMYSYNPTPFFREPCHYMSDLAGTSCVVIKTCAQCGKSLSLMNFLGWSVEFMPSNTLLVLDSLKQGMRFSQNRVRPFLRDVCGINNPNNSKNKNPDRSNSVVNIGLRSGANLFVASAKSASDSKSTPARFVLMDEVDAFPPDVNGEGDPVTLFMQRAKRYRSMCTMTSTPTTPEGAITVHWKLGTAQTWGVVCSTCGQWMRVDYDNIDFTGSTPTVACPHCGEVFDEEQVKHLVHCYNEPTNKDPLSDDFGRIRRSYEVTAPLCHSFVSWDSLKRQEIAALALGESSYKSFRNTVLGECYTPKDEYDIQVPDLMRLSQGSYTHDALPIDLDFIVLGVDTHDTALYVETCGFSSDLKRMYGIRYDVLLGDPNESSVWEQLGELFNAEYFREDGIKLLPAFIFQDSGGHRTNAVYLQTFKTKRFLPVKGMVTHGKNADPLLGKLQKFKLNAGVKGSVQVQMVGVSAGKDDLARAELLTVAGEKLLFYPKGYGYTLEYFKGLLSEKKIDGKWVAPRGSHTTNEPLDCRIYCMACAAYYLKKYWLTGKDKEALEAIRSKQGGIMKKEKVEKEEKAVEAPKRGRKPKKIEAEPEAVGREEVKPVVVEEPPKKKFKHL